ncbi:MAG: ABC transporter permease, partial [Chloroflexi bacterium]|nr:ABC transporter permease [Chloroflexota bacterium]
MTTVSTLDAEGLRSVSLWHITWRRLFRRRSAIVGMVILGILTFIALTAPWLAPYDPYQVLIGVEPVQRREAPCIHLLGCPKEKPQHIMGIDGNVRDQFSRILYGARLSLMIGFATVTFAIVIGTVLGAIAGYFGGWLDNVIMRVMDVLLAFPALLLAIAIVTVLGPGLINALIAIGIVSIPAYARVVRASVLSVREMDYVAASRALGGSSFHILFRRILPNALTPLIVQ